MLKMLKEHAFLLFFFYSPGAPPASKCENKNSVFEASIMKMLEGLGVLLEMLKNIGLRCFFFSMAPPAELDLTPQRKAYTRTLRSRSREKLPEETQE